MGRAAACPRSDAIFVYTMAGSVGLLLSFVAIFQCTGSFDFINLAELARNGQLIPALTGKFGAHTVEQVALIIFAGAFLGFAVVSYLAARGLH